MSTSAARFARTHKSSPSVLGPLTTEVNSSNRLQTNCGSKGSTTAHSKNLPQEPHKISHSWHRLKEERTCAIHATTTNATTTRAASTYAVADYTTGNRSSLITEMESMNRIIPDPPHRCTGNQRSQPHHRPKSANLYSSVVYPSSEAFQTKIRKGSRVFTYYIYLAVTNQLAFPVCIRLYIKK